MLIHDKHEGWLATCTSCDDGFQYGIGETLLCDDCEGAAHWQATLDDFDGDMVRLHCGATVLCEGGAFFDKDCNELASADVTDIAAVLEAVAA